MQEKAAGSHKMKRVVCGLRAGVVCIRDRCAEGCPFFDEYIKTGNRPTRVEKARGIRRQIERSFVPEDLRKRRGR